MERLLRLLLLALAVFDFALGTFLIFFYHYLPERVLPPAYFEPRFFMICTSLFLYQYTYIQYMGYRDPYRYATCLNLTLSVRLPFPALYIAGVLLWGAPFTLLHWMFLASAAGDLAVSLFILYAMRQLNIPLFKGDATAVDYSTGPTFLKTYLLILTVGELIIGSNFLLVPKVWLNLFQLPFTVDPWWTRATGFFLMNIAYIQYLGYVNVYRYSQATLVSGLYRALWPGLYWYWILKGSVGSSLFKGFLLFFSFFNIFSCAFILWSLKKALSQPAPNPPPKASNPKRKGRS
jgi:hypothetical protein